MWHSPTKTTFNLQAMPSGRAGVARTLQVMCQLANAGKKSPAVLMFTRELFRKAKLPQKAYRREAEVIQRFVRDCIRYVRDPVGVETVTTPEKLLELRQGDCDDKSTLAAAMLMSAGHPCRFIAVGFTPGHFSHVFTQTRLGGQWVTVETTEPWPLGKSGPRPVERMIRNC